MSDRTVTFSELASENLIEVGAGRPRSVLEQYPSLPILRVADVLDGRIESSSRDLFLGDHQTVVGSKISKPGDVILTAKGTVGRVALMPSEGPIFAYSPQLCYFRLAASGPLRSRYLYYWFKSADFWNQADALKGQTDMADYLSLSDVQALKIRLPSLSYQDATIAILGAIDDKITVNNEVANTALDLALAKYAELETNGLLARSLSMSDSARWFSGGTPKTSEGSYWDGDIPWISALSLKSPWIDDSDRRVTGLGAASGTRLVPKDTIIFVVRGSSLDTEFRIGITQREVAFGQDCKALRALAGIDAAVLFVAIKARTPVILRLVDHTGHGAGRLATDLLSKVVLGLPEAEFNAKVRAILRPLVDIGATRQAENRILAELRGTLLPKLLSGQVRVRDAEKVVEDVT